MELTDVVGVFCAAEERLKDPILQMLSRKRDAGFCIAIVKTVFTRTAEGLPIAAFNARLESCISYIRSSEECRLPGWCFGNDEEDVSVYAKRAFDMLAKPIATGGYGWLRCERAEETLKETVFISMNGLSALDMYDRLGMEAKAFTGVKAEDFAYQMNDLTTLLTMDRRSRIRQLEERIAPYQHQIEILRAGGDMGSIENSEIEERLRHMYDIVTQMPTAIRRTRDAEKQAIEKLSENYRTGSMSAAASITQYTDTFVERFENSDDGQSYSHASKTLFGLKDAGNLGTLRMMIASNAQVTKSIQTLLIDIETRLGDIFTELRGVQSTFNEGMSVIQRLSNQRENARWRGELELLARATECFSAWSEQEKGRNPKFPLSLPYGCQGNLCFYPHTVELNFGKARPADIVPAPIDDSFDASAQIENAKKVSSGSSKRILKKIARCAIPDETGQVDLIAAFNTLPQADRLVQDMAALYCKFGNGAKLAGMFWKTIDSDGNELIFLSGELNVSLSEIESYLNEGKEAEGE